MAVPPDHQRRHRLPAAGEAPTGAQTIWTAWSCRTAATRPQETAERSETRNAVRAALCQLTDEHREVLLLRYMQELDYGEIARALRISEGTVKSRINRAKAA